MITGVNRDANNIFTRTHESLSRVRSGGSSASESHLKDLSRKDTASVTGIAKDEIEYQIDDMMFDQDKEWQNENFDRAFSTFKD
ncbi:MAG: hypothetical protein NC200_03640 [Candidatus Gastranaerophilales bacterium]|nr:hypothetical protein [Candidatus Gastranaerophilales bacterium]